MKNYDFSLTLGYSEVLLEVILYYDRISLKEVAYGPPKECSIFRPSVRRAAFG
jgi:hypothetical protein